MTTHWEAWPSQCPLEGMAESVPFGRITSLGGMAESALIWEAPTHWQSDGADLELPQMTYA